MLTINGVSYNKYLTACTVSQVTRSDTVINTLAGTQYPYGTGKGYEAAMTLSLVPTDIVRSLTHAITGAGTTFTASFLGGGAETVDRTCRASNVSTALQNVADGGYWTVSATVITVD